MMARLLGLSKRIDRLSDAVGGLCDWLLLLSVLISAGNAVVRYAFNLSSNGWLEIQWYLFGAVVFLGVSQTLRMNEHVRVDVIYSSFSDRGRMWLDLWGFIFLFMPAVTYFFVLSLPFFAASVASGEYLSNAGGLLLWPVKLLLPDGFGLLLAQGLSEIVKRIAGLSGHSDFHPHYEKPLQ